MKDLKNLKGAKELSKKEQKSLKGGLWRCFEDSDCRPYWYCNSAGRCHPHM